MPGGRAYRPPTSKAQARLFGAAAAGQIPGFSPTEARNKLRGVKESKLPARAQKNNAKSR